MAVVEKFTNGISKKEETRLNKVEYFTEFIIIISYGGAPSKVI